MTKLNRTTGWLLFTQAAFVAAFVVIGGASSVLGGGGAHALSGVRSLLGIENSHVRLTDYVGYPMIFSAPVNLVLLLCFFWAILRRGHRASTAGDLFCILNAVYIAASGWILFLFLLQELPS